MLCGLRLTSGRQRKVGLADVELAGRQSRDETHEGGNAMYMCMCMLQHGW
jgi:hypothetical protein